MTYSAVYCALITKRLNNPITKNDCYCETHHIIPKSEGGDDDPQNLVNLTAREHYIAHLLLSKIYKDYKMYSAVRCMRTGRTFKFNSHLYEKLRKKYTNLSLETRKKLSDAHKGKQSPNKGKPMSEEQKQKLSKAHIGKTSWNKGKTTPAHIRKKLSDAKSGRNHPNFGKSLSEETRKKISKTLRQRRLKK